MTLAVLFEIDIATVRQANLSGGDVIAEETGAKDLDVVVLDKVLSSELDPSRYLLRAKELLKVGGLALITEITDSFEVS